MRTKEQISEYHRKWRESHKDSVNQKQREWRAANPEKSKAHSKKWRDTNPDQAKETNRRWRENNSDKVSEIAEKYKASHREEIKARMALYSRTDAAKDRNRKYRAEHREEINAKNRARYHDNIEKEHARSRAYHESHKEERSQAAKEWKKNNPEKQAAMRHNRSARVTGNGGKYTAGEWENLVSEYEEICLCRGEKLKLTVDHIVPVSRGGRNEIDNIQPLCGSHNYSKQSKTVDYRLLRAIDMAKSMQRNGNVRGVPKSYLDVPWFNLFENARYIEE